MPAFTAADMKRISEADSPTPELDSPVRQEKLLALAESLAGQSAQPAYSPVVLAGVVRICEFMIVFVASLAARRFIVPSGRAPNIDSLAIGVGVAALATLAFQAVKANTITAFRASLRSWLRMAIAWTAVMLAAATALFFLKPGTDF